jgi:hypothetical protein
MSGKTGNHRPEKGDESLLVELFDKGLTDGPVIFGRYLRAKGLISEEDIFNARMLQKKQNRKIGEIAVERGLMDIDSVERLLVYQEESGILFGELAVRLGYLSRKQVDALLEYKEKSYIYFGEALVRMGVLDAARMRESLDIFHRLKIRMQQMEA